MQLGMIGLGKMGANMAERLVKAGHSVIGYDRDPAAMRALAGKGGRAAASIEELVQMLERPRAVWVMVPAGEPVTQTLARLETLMSSGDAVIDGGNSYYKDTLNRSGPLAAKGIALVDAGTSGGIWGLQNGYCLMIGGDETVVARLQPIFVALAPSATEGWAHVGPIGAGHFVKMVHNGIEYGMMQAYAEGLAILEKKTEFKLELAQIAELWRHGSVVRSWLLDLCGDALKADAGLTSVGAKVADSGEGRWTVAEAIELGVPAPVITASLLERLRSRVENSFSDRLLSALRKGFGGHIAVK